MNKLVSLYPRFAWDAPVRVPFYLVEDGLVTEATLHTSLY